MFSLIVFVLINTPFGEVQFRDLDQCQQLQSESIRAGGDYATAQCVPRMVEVKTASK